MVSRSAHSWLITGATGFLGRRLVARLLAGGDAVTAVVRSPAQARVGHGGRLRSRAVDLAGTSDPWGAIAARNVDVVVHLAVARADGTAAARIVCTQTNVMVTAALLEGAAAAGVRRFVHVGGSLEYGLRDEPIDEDAPLRPHGYYGATKAAGSLLAIERGRRGDLETAILRPFLLYGPGQRPDAFIPSVLEVARRGGEVALTAGAQAHDWTHVDDVAAACIAAGTSLGLEPGLVVNVGTGAQWTNDAVVSLAREVTGRPIVIGATRTPPRQWDRTSWVADPTRLRQRLGVEPRGLREGLEALWAA